jgi:hypothetical protein
VLVASWLLPVVVALSFGPPLVPWPSFDVLADYWTRRAARGPGFAEGALATLMPWALAILWLAAWDVVLWRTTLRRWRSLT